MKELRSDLRDKILNMELLPNQAALFYIGQVGFIIKYQNTYTMIDGYLSHYVDKNCSSALVRWKRLYPAPIQAENLDFLDFIFCTHAHFDHADPWTIHKIAEVNHKAIFIGPSPVCSVYSDCGVPTKQILQPVIDSPTVLGPGHKISFTMIPAAHEELHPDQQGGFAEVGYRISFGYATIYHSGDCCPYDGLESRIMNCDALILPVNGRDYYRRNVKDIIGCFDSTEAITLAADTHAGMLIPVHWDLYHVNEINPGTFVDLAHRLHPELPFHIFVPGEGYILSV